MSQLTMLGAVAGLLLGAPAAHGQAPVFERAQVVGGAPAGGGNSSVTRVVPDGQGHVYVAGAFSGRVQLGNATLISSWPTIPDAYVAKLDAQGNCLWAAAAGGAEADWAFGLAVDAAGNAYVAGQFASPSMAFGARTLYNSSNQTEAFVAKLDPTGNWLWARRAGGIGSEAIMDLAVRGNSLYAVGGFASRTADFGPFTLTNGNTVSDSYSDCFVARLDADTGTWTWAVGAGAAGPSDDGISALALDGAGDLYVAGSYSGTSAVFGSTTLTAPTRSDKPFVARLTPGGRWRWAVAGDIGNSVRGGANCHAIAVDGAGRVAVAGGLNCAALRLGPATLGVTGAPDNDGYYPGDAFVAQLDTAGAWRWAAQTAGPGNDTGSAVLLDAAGNTTLAVGFRATAQFGSTTLSSPNGGSSMGLAQLGPTGAWRWATRSGGGSGGRLALAADAAGRTYAGGTFAPGVAADFGPFVLPANPQTPLGTTLGTGFVARLAAGPLAAAPRRTPGWQLYPNPARGAVQLVGVPAGTLVELLDLLGRPVRRTHAPAGAGPWRWALPAALPAGVYLVRCQGQLRRLVVQP